MTEAGVRMQKCALQSKETPKFVLKRTEKRPSDNTECASKNSWITPRAIEYVHCPIHSVKNVTNLSFKETKSIVVANKNQTLATRLIISSMFEGNEKQMRCSNISKVFRESIKNLQLASSDAYELAKKCKT